MIASFFAAYRVYFFLGLLAAAAVAGGYAVRNYYVARERQQQVNTLQRAIQARDAAETENNRRYAVDQQTIAALRRSIEDAVNQTSVGECLPAADTERVRSIFRTGQSRGGAGRFTRLLRTINRVARTRRHVPATGGAAHR